MDGAVACFGEVMLRYSARDDRTFEQTNGFDICVGGAEANVAVGLANLGRHARMISVLPDDPLGRRARKYLAGQRVDISAIHSGDGRMGTYLYSAPSGARSGEVVYDRMHSAFSLAQSGSFDFDAVLQHARHLHLSGISLALSEGIAEATIAIATAAKQRGLTISFDGNFRPALWAQTARDPRDWIGRVMVQADLVFGNHKDVALLLGQDFSGDGEDRRRAAASALMDAFPNISAVSSTARHIDGARAHRITGRLDTATDSYQSNEWLIEDIVDRIGTGDAFAAGILHGWLDPDCSMTDTVEQGMGLMALKHATWGDCSLATASDLAQTTKGHGDIRR